MKVTYKWLQEYVDIPWSPEELAEKLTLSGSEVESIGPIPPLFGKIVIGIIDQIKSHPSSTHLSICQVNLGGRTEQIVCGAPNVKKGLRVPVVLPGSQLPSGLEIKRAKIRCVESSGMICSEKELGISQKDDTVMELSKQFKPGSTFIPLEFQDDTVFDIFINFNRPDCMSVRGLAREIAALSGKKLKSFDIKLSRARGKYNEDFDFSIDIIDPEKCPRYCGAIITGIKTKPSPFIIQQRLFAAGIRPINNIVDATNYCLVELGQPLHAFDLNHLDGNKIVVKTAKKKQQFITLDNVQRVLNEDVIMICDAKKPVAIGGIMGGLNSEISDGTQDILLESAYFDPINIRNSAKYLGLYTEASRRFERGMDPNFTMTALEKLCSLILSISPGQIHKPFYNTYPKKSGTHKVLMRTKRLNSVLGTNFSNNHIEKSLKSLELDTKLSGKEKIQCTIPTFRHDLNREIDLIEEVFRISGLDKIEPRQKAVVQLRDIKNPQTHALSRLRSHMTELGFMEVYNYSMIEAQLHEHFLDRGRPVILKNPISPEYSLMRPSLIPGLLQTALFNRNRDVDNLRIFELGKIYGSTLLDKKIHGETHSLAGVIYGQQSLPSWDNRTEVPVDLFTIKGILSGFLRKISLDIIEFISYDNLYLESVSTIKSGDKTLGFFGQYRNNSLAVSFNEPVFTFELHAEPLLKHLFEENHFKPFSKYPPAKRELAFVIPDTTPVQGLINTISGINNDLLKSISVEDVFQGDPIPERYRSVRLSFKFFANDRSLVDEDVESVIDTIINVVKSKHSIDIRR